MGGWKVDIKWRRVKMNNFQYEIVFHQYVNKWFQFNTEIAGFWESPIINITIQCRKYAESVCEN